MREYNFKEVEEKWQKKWNSENLFKTNDKEEGKENYYVLEMLPYPSGNSACRTCKKLYNRRCYSKI